MRKINKDRMRLRRLELRLSQEELAKRTGISQPVIAKLEGGKLSGRLLEQQEALAEALGLTLDELCEGPESTRKSPPHTLPATPLSAPAAPRDEGPVDDVLGHAWDPETHRVVDLLVVRAAILADPDDLPPPRELLDAAARLRARGKAPTLTALLKDVLKRLPEAGEASKPVVSPRSRKARAG